MFWANSEEIRGGVGKIELAAVIWTYCILNAGPDEWTRIRFGWEMGIEVAVRCLKRVACQMVRIRTEIEYFYGTRVTSH